MKKKHRKYTVIAAAIACTLLMVGIAIHRNLKIPTENDVVLLIPSGSDYAAVCDTLSAHGCHSHLFGITARLRNYPGHVKSGRYVVKPGMDWVQLVQKLYSGSQDPVRITIGKHRTTETLCEYLGKQLELSADTLLALLHTDSVAEYYGYNRDNFLCLFCRNTYDIYWNTSPQRFLSRMEKENQRFWNDRRMEQCRQTGLTAAQVTILASIVEEETNCNEEKDTIASVYLNRLRKGMPLQADPTLKYAVGDFTLRRLGRQQIEYESPYNTYRHAGLPPGPICIPSTESIEAVLENLPTSYIYFCAKDDFSGRHNFATTLAQHSANAARFHKALNLRNIH
ncbi:MAG: endolytic transglycosylase MltG [Bacteroidales bacterium]|nr:endolytic transglycosylase MltG [Bacteroidales bacterium]